MFIKLYKKMKIRSKVVSIYIIILVISILISFSIFNIINERYLENEHVNNSVENIKVLEKNLNYIFENVFQFSNILYFDSNIQSSAEQIKDSTVNPKLQNSIIKSLANMLLASDYTDSVIIFDNFFNVYAQTRNAPQIDGELIKETNWYKDALLADGQIVLGYGTEGVVKYKEYPNKDSITVSRIIKNIYDYTYIGTLLITIDTDEILKCINEVGEQYNSQYCIVDENNIPLVYEENSIILDYIPEGMNNSSHIIVNINGRKNILVKEKLSINDWSIIGLKTIDSSELRDDFQKSLIMLIIMLNIFVIAICSIVLMKLVFNPLTEVVEHMKYIENGEFVEISFDNNVENEINDLKIGYNAMVIAIKNLIIKTKEEEKIIAKNELDLLQAQINPHFLYNTLGAVSALALINDNEGSYKITQELGKFYRNSLNGGKQLVSVEDEIECVKSYIDILNVRYNNSINIICDIEEKINNKKILKLILQPIVENAIYHGIRKKKERGTINIIAFEDEDELIFIVSDDGSGMSEDRIDEVLAGKCTTNKNGFGVFNSIQRISLYYGIENPITITSELDVGTEVTIRVKSGD